MRKLFASVGILLAAFGARAQSDVTIDDHVRQAMRRDLSLTDDQIDHHVRARRKADAAHARLLRHYGDDFAGTWINRRGDSYAEMVVALANGADQKAALGMGADRIVAAKYSLSSLQQAHDTLDQHASFAGTDKIRGWELDVPNNRIVIRVAPGATADGYAFAETAGVSRSMVYVKAQDASPQLTASGGVNSSGS